MKNCLFKIKPAVLTLPSSNSQFENNSQELVSFVLVVCYPTILYITRRGYAISASDRLYLRQKKTSCCFSIMNASARRPLRPPLPNPA